MKHIKYLVIITLLAAIISHPTGFFSFSSYQKHLQDQQRVILAEKAKRAKLARYDKQMKCLRQALWFEARGEPEHGIRAVATVIINRVRHDKYPNKFCTVIHQPKQFSYTHQFKSYSINPAASEVEVLLTIDKIVAEVYTSDFVAVLPPDVLWYHTVRVKPSWSKSKEQVALIGNHIFRK